MIKQTIRLFFLLVCLGSYNLHSQIVVSASTVCVQSSVSFSVYPNGATYSWNFGNGQQSTLQFPGIPYNTAGIYNVSCTVTTAGGPQVYTTSITVKSPPTANFSYTPAPNGCAPRAVSFTDLSTGSSPITGWNWDFGDGSPFATTSNPTHVYTIPGSYTVKLFVTDGVCSATISLGPIKVSALPSPVITSNPASLNSCVAPFSPTFSGSQSSTNPAGGTLTYSWTFAGGSPASSTQQNPGAVTYSTVGNHNVSLTVTDNNNCSANINLPVTVSTPSVNVTMPSTICIGSTLTAIDQSNVGFTFWQMGDGASYNIPTSASSQTIHLYPNPGTYTVTITATSGTCQAQTTKTILVQQVVSNFTHTPPSFTCSPTMTIGLVNQSSSNAVTYTWTASNYNGASTSTSTLTNPTFTIVQGSLNPYTIYQTFNINVTLIAQSAFGCVSTVTMHVYDSIRRPTAWFTKDKQEGCAPLVVKFRDSSFTSSLYPITSYTWNNGASPPQFVTGTVPPAITNPTFTYSSPGTYTPYLIVQTATGCIDTSFVDTITVVNPPNISFSFSPATACWNQPVQIINTSPSLTPAIQHWHVESDNGFFSHCINDPNPSWNFTHVGTHTFALSGYHHSCKGTSSSTAAVTVKGPIVRSRYETNCANRKTVSFFSHLQDAQSATLDFGDNSSVSIAGNAGGIATHNVAHTYSASGNYTAVITGSNSVTGCSPNTFTMLVTVRDAVASFTMPSVVCASVAQTFDASSSQDVYIGCKRGYVWYIDNLPPRDTTSPFHSYVFTSAGMHTVTLMVKDENSCADTMRATFRVSAANPSFTMSANPICLSTGSVSMINTTSQTPDPITGYSWNFGDGSAVSTLTNPTHFYTSATIPSQIYTISLTATNDQGCTDTKTHTIQVNNPSAALSINPVLPCVGTPVLFSAPAGYLSYTFNVGVGNPIVVFTNTVSYTYTSAGVYSGSVSILDNGQCKSSSPTSTVSVQGIPSADFAFTSANATSTNNICAGSPVSFTSTSQSQHQLNYTWNLGSNSPIINSGTVVTTYTNVGSIPISLTVSTIPNGCTHTITKTVTIYGAAANLNLNKTTVCLGNSIAFNVKDSSTVFAWTWFFGDGDTLRQYTGAGQPIINHLYSSYPQPSGNTEVTLYYWSANFACKYVVKQPIQILKIDANFNRNNEILKQDSVHCIGISDVFTNNTPGSAGYNFSWAFGDGSMGTGSPSNYTYPNAGVYQVTLTVTDPVNNCMGYAIKNMTINPLPSVVINAPDSVCSKATFSLIANASPNVVSYSWSPAGAVVSPSSAITSAGSSVSPMSYSLQVTDANGCTNSAIKNIYIQLEPVNTSWDSTVIIGQHIPMNGYAGVNFSYTWTPPTHLSCVNCISPVSTSTSNITYTLEVEDKLGCFKTTNIFTIYVEPKATVDVPTAFTPNGDGVNDIIYVDGWGIKKLNYFRIFNRWGQLLFESTDIKTGWDGFFSGIPQNMETYVYQVSVETFVDKDPVLKTGSFKLIR